MNAPALFDVDTPPPPSAEPDPRDTLLPRGGREQDHERALRLMEALAPGTCEAKIIVIPGEPASKSRPRFTRKGKPYRTKEDVDAEQRTAAHIRRVFPEPWTGNMAVGCVFFRPNKQRIDVDNMLKHVCDAANHIAWLDDSQITALYGIAEMDAAEPRTIIVFTTHTSSLVRGSDNMRPCERCSKPFPLMGTSKKRFCGKSCSYKARGHDLNEPVHCKHCKRPFRRTTTAQTMCSRECWADHLRGKAKARAKPKSVCPGCGKTLAHSRGGRCRECWRADPFKPNKKKATQ